MASVGAEHRTGIGDRWRRAGRRYSERPELVGPFVGLGIVALFLEWGIELLELLFDVEEGPTLVVDRDVQREAATGPVPEALVPILEEFAWLFVLGVFGTALLAVLVALVAMGVAFLVAADVVDGRDRLQRDRVAVAASRLPAVVGGTVVGAVLVGIGLLLLVVPGLYLAVRFGLALPAIVVDDLGPIEGLRAGWAASSGRFVDVGGLVLVAALAIGVASLLPYLGALIAVFVILPAFSLALADCYLEA